MLPGLAGDRPEQPSLFSTLLGRVHAVRSRNGTAGPVHRRWRSRARRPQRRPTTIELLPNVAGDPVGGSRVPAHQFDRFAQLESLLAVGRGHGGAYQ